MLSRLGWMVAAVAFGACGRCGYDAIGHLGDASADARSGLDASGDGGGPAVGFAPPSGYELLTLPAGADLRDFAWSRSDTSIIYASTEGGRVFVSTDRGGSWGECTKPDGNVFDLAVANDDPMHVFATEWRGAMRSDDGCASWTSDALGDSGDSVIVLADGTVVLTAPGLHRWDGTAWVPIASPFDAWNIEGIAVSNDGARWLAGAYDHGVILSTDGAATWEIRNAGMTSLRVVDVALDPIVPDRMYAQTVDALFQSVDGASTWQQIGGGRDTVAVHPVDSDFIVFMANNDLRSSEDGGMTTQADRRSPAMNASVVRRLRFDPTDPASLYAATRRGLFVDGNRAWTWEARNTGLSAWSVLDIARGIDGTLYVGTQAGVLASTDEGASFTHSTDGMVFTSEVREVVPHPDDAGIVFLAGRFLWRSDDRGRTWTEVHRPGAEDGWTITSLTVVAEGILAGTGNRLLLFDGTPSEPISVGPNVPRPGGPSDVVDPQAILRVGPSLAIVTTPSGVYSTTDGGATFTAHSDGLPPSPDCRNVVATASGRFVLRVDRDAYTADSLGATWTRAEVGGRVLHLSAAGDNVLAVLDVGVAISRDAGRTWTTRSDLSAFFPKSGMVEPDGSTLLGTGGFGLWRSVP